MALWWSQTRALCKGVIASLYCDLYPLQKMCSSIRLQNTQLQHTDIWREPSTSFFAKHIGTYFDYNHCSSVKKDVGMGFIYLLSLLHHPYFVCNPTPASFYIFNVLSKTLHAYSAPNSDEKTRASEQPMNKSLLYCNKLLGWRNCSEHFNCGFVCKYSSYASGVIDDSS